MIPAAILGVPASIFAVIGPIHLFLQFWYHTRLINKMGWLEKVIVTPSHHRVHHGINPEYLDKNYSAIFIIWDKLFGTFQPELADVKPVYGILRPANTWNPIIINFKHLWQLIMDAFHAEKWRDKIRIWFMPTGWRPEDVAQNYPVKTIENPLEQIKYKTVNSPLLIIWGWLQMFITFGFMFHLFIISTQFGPTIIFLYALFLFINVFAYTSLLDGNDLALYTEIIKFIMGLGFIWIQNFSWFGTSGISTIIMGVYLILSLGITIYSLIVEPKSPQLKTT